MRRVLVSCLQMQACFDEFHDRFAAAGLEADLPEVRQQLREDDLLPIIGRYVGVIAGDDEITAAVLERGAPNLKVVSKWGVGVDNIDLAAAARLGIRVTNTPGVFGAEVADVCVGYLVLLARRLHIIDAAVRAGTWKKIEGTSLGGRTLGIVGLGDIGRALACRALAMEMHVIASDPAPGAHAQAKELGVEIADVVDLFRRSDAVSLNCPLTPDNHHFVNAEVLAEARPGLWLVNTARGGLVDEAALIDALDSGRVGRAALDVFEREPVAPDNPLLSHPSVIVGSHNGSNTREAVLRTSALAVRNLLEGLSA